MKALITQREQIDCYGVPIDVFESTYIIYFEKLELELFQLSNFTMNIDNILATNKFDFIILTGGGSIHSKFYGKEHNNFLQSNRDKLEWKLMDYALINKIPILAICRGMQYMNVYLGGKIAKLELLKESRPIGKEHNIILGNGTKIFVNNYHDDGIHIKDLSETFEIIGIDVENDIVEAIYSDKMKWFGIQWHPERLMKDKFSEEECTKLISNFIRSRGVVDESYYFSSWTGN